MGKRLSMQSEQSVSGLSLNCCMRPSDRHVDHVDLVEIQRPRKANLDLDLSPPESSYLIWMGCTPLLAKKYV